MSKRDLFSIQKKYIELLIWFEDMGYIPKKGMRTSEYYISKHNNKELEIYPNITIARGLDYIDKRKGILAVGELKHKG